MNPLLGIAIGITLVDCYVLYKTYKLRKQVHQQTLEAMNATNIQFDPTDQSIIVTRRVP